MSRLTTAQRESAYYNLVQTYRQQVNDMDFTNYSTRIAGLRSIYNTMELLNNCFAHDRNVTGYAYTELTTMVEQIKDLIDEKLSQIEY